MCSLSYAQFSLSYITFRHLLCYWIVVQFPIDWVFITFPNYPVIGLPVEWVFWSWTSGYSLIALREFFCVLTNNTAGSPLKVSPSDLRLLCWLSLGCSTDLYWRWCSPSCHSHWLFSSMSWLIDACVLVPKKRPTANHGHLISSSPQPHKYILYG